MKYDFETIMDRAGKDAIAIDGVGMLPGFTPTPPKEGFDLIPMWVADMNFPTVPTVVEAIKTRADHTAFGYFQLTDEYFNSIIKWHEYHNNVKNLSKEHIGYENGVIGGVLTALRVMTSQGDKILVHSPTYIGFTMSLHNNGYNVVHSQLVEDENGIMRMDFEDMERCIIENDIHATIFCSPHNPCGRVWEEWEIKKAMDLFEKYNVYVVSDEIWSDIIIGENKHIPTQSVSEYAREHTVGMYAPSKTFNLAGLVGSYHIVYNKWLKDRMMKEASLNHYNVANVFSMHALIGAYKEEGYEWVKQLRETIKGNIDYACEYIENNFDGVEVKKPEGTYMLFVDCTNWCIENNKTIDQVEQAAWDVGVAVQDGKMFHGPNHFRINLALPLSRVKEAMERLDKYVFNANHNEQIGKEIVVGDKLDDLKVNTVFKKDVTLSELSNKVSGKTAIIFLRYYGCTICQMDINHYKKEYEKIIKAGGQIVIVFQSSSEIIQENLNEGDLPFDIICDPDKSLYQKYNVLPSQTLQAMIDKKALYKVAVAKKEGIKHGKYEGDELQLPATIIIDNELDVNYVHYGKTVGDILSVDELVEVLK